MKNRTSHLILALVWLAVLVVYAAVTITVFPGASVVAALPMVLPIVAGSSELGHYLHGGEQTA